MTTPEWMLLGFAAWTVLLLFFHPSGSIVGAGFLTRASAHQQFPWLTRSRGEDWYKRAMRAPRRTASKILPVFGAIVFALFVSHVSGPAVDILVDRHLDRSRRAVVDSRELSSQTNSVVAVRFTLFCVQGGQLPGADRNHCSLWPDMRGDAQASGRELSPRAFWIYTCVARLAGDALSRLRSRARAEVEGPRTAARLIRAATGRTAMCSSSIETCAEILTDRAGGRRRGERPCRPAAAFACFSADSMPSVTKWNVVPPFIGIGSRRVMRQHERRHVIWRLVAPPAFPVLIRPMAPRTGPNMLRPRIHAPMPSKGLARRPGYRRPLSPPSMPCISRHRRVWKNHSINSGPRPRRADSPDSGPGRRCSRPGTLRS